MTAGNQIIKKKKKRRRKLLHNSHLAQVLSSTGKRWTRMTDVAAISQLFGLGVRKRKIKKESERGAILATFSVIIGSQPFVECNYRNT